MRHLITFGLFGITLISQATFANPQSGKELHEKACQSCHDNGIYKRNNSIIHSFTDLQARVEFCEQASQQHWSEKQAKTVTDYLNKTFYKYPNK